MESIQCHGAGGGGGYVKSSVPDLSGVDYEQPLEMLRSAQAQVMTSFYPDIEGKQYSSAGLQAETCEGEILSVPVRNQAVLGINNNGLAHLEYRDAASSGALQAPNVIKQEPLASPTNTAGATKPTVNHRKKRRRDPSVPAVEEPSCEDSAGSAGTAGSSVKIKSENDGGDQTQSVHFSPFQATKWRETFTSNLENLKTPVVKVIADKGFNFSQVDDAFIAQKKNHFQLSCHISKEGEHDLVGTETGYNKIQYLQLNFYGVKKEAPEQKIQVIQEIYIEELYVCFEMFRLSKVRQTDPRRSSSQ